MIPLIWLVGLAVTAVVVASFWSEIKNWATHVYSKLPPILKNAIQGFVTLIEKIEETVKNIIAYYSYNEKTEKWTETTVSREISENDVPKKIRDKFKRSQKIDISDELQMEYSQ